MIDDELLQNTSSRVDTEASTGHNFVDLKTEEGRSSKTSVSMHNHTLCHNSERSLDQYPFSEPENVVRILQIRRTNQNGANMPTTGGIFDYVRVVSSCVSPMGCEIKGRKFGRTYSPLLMALFTFFFIFKHIPFFLCQCSRLISAQIWH